MLLTYEDYKELGGSLERVAFDRFSFRAEQVIKQYAQKTEYNEIFNRCMFELIYYLSNSSVDGAIKDISSVSNDGYSVSYTTDTGSSDGNKTLRDIVYAYLLENDYLYRGTGYENN